MMTPQTIEIILISLLIFNIVCYGVLVLMLGVFSWFSARQLDTGFLERHVPDPDPYVDVEQQSPIVGLKTVHQTLHAPSPRK